MTLLEIVQDVLSSLDSDEVNSVVDTTESMQVATLVKTVYNDIISRANLPEHFDIFELNASGDPTKPTLLFRPTNCQNILWVKYDKKEVDETVSNFLPIKYLEPESFLDRVFSYEDSGQGDVETYNIATKNISSIEIRCLNNKAPDFYTCWDDNLVIFDSYNRALDTTLQKNKTMVYGEYEPDFRMEDSFVPDLDSRQFSLLYNEVKATAFAELKQVENGRAERSAKRAWVTLAHQKHSIPADIPYRNSLANYGRKR